MIYILQLLLRVTADSGRVSEEWQEPFHVLKSGQRPAEVPNEYSETEEPS